LREPILSPILVRAVDAWRSRRQTTCNRHAIVVAVIGAFAVAVSVGPVDENRPRMIVSTGWLLTTFPTDTQFAVDTGRDRMFGRSRAWGSLGPASV
jgi:hypothetical protein